MLTFQWIVIPLLCIVALMETRAIINTGLGRRYHLVRLLIILTAITAISQPDLTGWLAVKVGITRGADLVIYVFMLFTLGAIFRLYTGQFVLEQRIAQLSRVTAIEKAERGGALRASLRPDEESAQKNHTAPGDLKANDDKPNDDKANSTA